MSRSAETGHRAGGGRRDGLRATGAPDMSAGARQALPRTRVRAGIGVLLVAGLALTAAGCTVISDQGVVVSTGEIGDFWDVRWNPTLGTPSMMTNRSLQDVVVNRDTPAIAGSAAEAAVREVFERNDRWFRLRPDVDALTVVGSRASGWLRHVEFQQYYRGVPVAGAGYEARVFPTGRVGSIEGRFHPDLEMIVTPSVNGELAAARAHALLVNGVFSRDVPVLRFEIERALDGDRGVVIVPVGNRLVLAWAVMVENGPRERARVYMNAETGEVIGMQPVAGNWMR